MFEAYASGVNQAIADGGAAAARRGTTVEDWRVVGNSVAAVSWCGTSRWEQWQAKLGLRGAGSPRGRRPTPSSGLESRAVAGSPLAVAARRAADAPGRRAARRGARRHRGAPRVSSPRSRPRVQRLGRERAAHPRTAGAVICNDSHRAASTPPNVYWQCRVTCPDFDVTGATFPGPARVPALRVKRVGGRWAITHGGRRHPGPVTWSASRARGT